MASSAIGLPAAMANAMAALATPHKIATASPRPKRNSFTLSCFCSADSSCSFCIPAHPLKAMPMRQVNTPARTTRPPVVEIELGKFALKNGWDKRSAGGAEPQGDGIAESDSEVSHCEAEGEAADAPDDSPKITVQESPSGGECAQHIRCLGNKPQCEYPWGDQPTENTTDDPKYFPGPIS